MTVLQTAQNWADQDPDSETRQALQTLIDQQNIAELSKLFSDRLQFGTAGLRGRLQAGTMGMNRVLVAQSAMGLANFLLSREDTPSIVIGYDARKNSKIFAEDTAQIMQGVGVMAHVMPDLRPTPVLAFAVRHLQASAGVMVTASHNPPDDNGYKVFLGGDDDGAQIVSPNDGLIAKHIQQVADHQSITDFARDDNYKIIDHSVIDEYIAHTASIAQAPISDLSYVYTAMHGVGTQTLQQVLDKANLPQPILVSEQCDPDGSFPTVDFPNPEEDGALDLAIATAKKHNAEFIIANDPDADRLAVAVADSEGNWSTLHGNEIGLYLAWYIGKQAQNQGKTGVLACSLVSSPVLGKVAKDCDLAYQETKTGFKWIGRVPNLIFGYEEALGYLTDPQKVHDKDGISAIVSFLDLINHLKANEQSFADYRQQFMATFGAFSSNQLSVRVEDLGRIERILASVRQQPFTNVADIQVTEYIDHLTTDINDNILVFHLENGHRIIFRPSGTEPKLKVYFDTQGTTMAEAQAVGKSMKQSLEAYVNHID